MAPLIHNDSLVTKVFGTNSKEDFDWLAMEIFRYQYEHNAVYQSYASAMGRTPAQVSRVGDIPFLPISFFKTHKVVCGNQEETDTVFTSSTTTGGIPSMHIVKNISIYEQSFRSAFNLFYGDITKYCILALLPSYLERSGSSLVYMAEDLVKQSGNPHSGFYLHNIAELVTKLSALEKAKQKTLLIGVTYALLNLAEKFSQKLSHTTIMETGGMKGKREELPREEVHQVLKQAFGIESVHSEYGMTELLSQAYSKGKGIFNTPPWMQVLIRDVYDPLKTGLIETSGAINIIDLGNVNSCSFIATDDAGIVHRDGSFAVSGRLDQSDIRGCNLMAGEI